MGLTTAFTNFLKNPKRVIQVFLMKIAQVIHLFLVTITCHRFFKNRNIRKSGSGIPQPEYYNTWSDIKSEITSLKLIYVNDLSKRF